MIRGAFLIFFLIGITFSHKTPFQPPNRPLYFAPSSVIKHFSFGFSDLYADLLWVRLIQDIDFCELEKGHPIYNKEVISFQCEKGWSYKVADAITELSPRFLKPYEVSPLILSIVMGDKEGAQSLFDKGVKRFPSNWRIHFYSGYHELFEMKNKRKAYDQLLIAAQNGGPQWLHSLVSKGYSELNEWFLARKVLTDFSSKEMGYDRLIQKRIREMDQKIKKLKLGF